MKKGIICLCIFLAVCLSGCSSVSNDSNSQPEPETIIVKETVIVTETVYVTESNNEETTTIEDTTSDDAEKKGYTTQDVLQKAANAADKEYWILYYWDNQLKMQSFNALEGFTVTLGSDKHLICDKLVGKITLYYWDEEKSDFSITHTTAYGDWGTSDIIGGNVDVIDEKNDKTIPARTD